MAMTERAICVVEDDAAFRALLLEFLTSLGYGVEVFSSAEDLMHHVGSADPPMPRLVISDIHMQRLTGFQLVRELRKSKPDVPVILMTAFGNPEIEETAIRHGASAYLEKPFHLSVMRDLLQKLIPEE
jgi:DNA-binding NtrC family response regulator